MILLVHMLFGAAIGSTIHNVYLAMTLALLGHYFLDFFPHIEYSIKHIRLNVWKKSLPDMIKVLLDFFLALLVIYLFSKNQLIIYGCAFIALIPDSLTIISDMFPNKILALHDYWHTKKIHYLTKQKNFSTLWKILTQIIAIMISLTLLRL